MSVIQSRDAQCPKRGPGLRHVDSGLLSGPWPSNVCAECRTFIVDRPIYPAEAKPTTRREPEFTAQEVRRMQFIRHELRRGSRRFSEQARRYGA